MFLIGWLASAHAQDVVVWDFDTTFPDVMSGYEPDALTVETPPTPWDGDALAIDLVAYGFPYVGGSGTLDELVVTHHRLGAQATTEMGWEQWVAMFLYRLPDGYPEVGSVGPLEVWPGAWSAYEGDVSGACGDRVQLIVVDSGYGSTYQWGKTYLDDVGFSGQVCDQFVDVDGDGLCLQGVDTDGDGTCVAAGEVLAPPEFADCDDTRVGPGCLGLTAGALVPGAPLRLTASGATPGATVGFARSQNLADSCPALLGGACLSLATPKLFGTAIADGSGVAVIDVNVPAGAPSGVFRWVQAAELVPGGPANVSSLVGVSVP